MSGAEPEVALDRTELPMFPLGSVLLPTMLLPLHVFEDRYRVMIERVLDGDGTFGVTMIERGSEVGGNDVRATVGCRARILEAEQQADGRWHLVAVGTERIAVDEWLPDDPYPRALVSSSPDTLPADIVDGDGWLELFGAFHELMSLIEQVSGEAVPRVTLADDPELATFQMAAVAPLGALDRHRVLCGEHAGVRRTTLLDAFEHLTVLVNDATTN